MTDRLKAHISKLIFNNGQTLEIKPSDIVLFVGPNNAGKTQALNDISIKCESKKPTVVLSDVETTKIPGSLRPLLDTVAKTTFNGNVYYYHGYEINCTYDPESSDTAFCQQKYYGQLKPLFIASLTTEKRLTVCKPVESVNISDNYTSPIHYAAFNYKHYGKWLSENFQRAFGDNLTANRLYGKTIPLCIGPVTKIKSGEVQEEIDGYAKTLETYKQVHNQGDGVKSFVGILLYLMLDYYCTYLIDEPESFLHPPQARIMGQIIGSTLKSDQQAFISTHSEEIVKGLLDECPERLKIVRITRTGDKNTFSILDNEKIKDVLGDPLLKYSNILSSLFHKTTVLCESDSDCRFYSIIDAHLKQVDNKYSETLFIHCSGKDRIEKTARALKALNVDVRLITDIDILDNEATIAGIANVFGVDWNSILKKDYKAFESNLHSPKEHIKREDARREILRILDASQDNADASQNVNDVNLTKEDIKKIVACVKTVSKWKNLKEYGKNAISAGDASKAFENIDKVLREHNIHVVPVGELENFVKVVGGHGPSWVNEVLKEHPDLEDDVYKAAKEFVKGIGL